MKLSYYHKALILGTVAIFYTNVSDYMYNSHSWTILEAPKDWVILLCLLSLPVMFTQATLLNALKSPVTVWCFGFAWLTLLSFFTSSHSEMGWQEVRYRFLAIIEIMVFMMIIWDAGAIRIARKTLVALVLMGVAVNIYELFVPLSFSILPGRSAGLYENPNLAGEALVLGMILSITVLELRYRAPFLLLSGIGVLVTLSRASILAWLIAVTGIFLVGLVHLKHVLLTGVVAFIVASVILLPRLDQILTTWERSGVINANVIERLAWLTDPSGVSDQSSWERKHVAKQSWDKIEEHPFLGSGTGSYHHMSVMPHNQYLSFMLDHGLMGVLILPLLILASAWGARGETRSLVIIFGCALMILSLFTHTVLNYAHNVLLLSLVAAMAATSRDRENKSTAAIEMQMASAPRQFVKA